MTFAQINALVADQGAIVCTDQDGILYAWSAGQAKYVAQVADNQTALARVSSTTLLTPSALGFAEQPTITGSAVFTRATNNIQITGIVAALGLEVGDVIQITGTASNNFTMTVEVITDANDINVNYEHRNGAGPLSLTNETVVCTIKLIAKWWNAPLGLGQAWVDLTGKRVEGTTYTNSLSRSISVGYGVSGNTQVLRMFGMNNGVHVVTTGNSGLGGSGAGFTFTAQPGTYEVAVSAYPGAATTWSELR